MDELIERMDSSEKKVSEQVTHEPISFSEERLQDHKASSNRLVNLMIEGLKSGIAKAQEEERIARREATNTWKQLIEVYLEVLDRDGQAREIEKLGNDLGLGDDYTESSSSWILRTAFRLDPEKALKFYQQVNPEIDLEHLPTLSSEEQYKVAIGLVRTYAEEEEERKA